MMSLLSYPFDFFHLFAGSGFFFLAISCLVIYFRKRHIRGLDLPWVYLSFFGFSQAGQEGLAMVADFAGETRFWMLARFVLSAVSFLSLFEFFRRFRKRFPGGRYTGWAHLLLVIAVVAGCLASSSWQERWIQLIFFMGLPALLATAWVFFYVGGQPSMGRFIRRSYVICALFLVYAFLLAWICLSQDGMVPACVHAKFLGFPADLWRGALISAMAFLLMHWAMKVTFEIPGLRRGSWYVRALFFSLLVLYLLFLAIGFHLVATTERHEREHLNQTVIANAKLLADAISEAGVNSLAAAGDISGYPQYRKVHQRMRQIAALAPFTRAAYLVGFHQGGLKVLVGSQGQVFRQEIRSSLVSDPETSTPIRNVFYSKNPLLLGPYRDHNERLVFSVFVPLLSGSEQVHSLLGLDLDASRLLRQVARVRFYVLLIVLTFLISLIVGHAFLVVFALKSLELEVQKENLDKTLRHLKETEAELARSEETFRGILNNSPNAIFGFDRDLRLIFWNQGAEDLYGYKKQDVINERDPLKSRHIVDLLGIKDLESEIRAIFSGMTFVRETQHATLRGPISAAMTAFPVKDPQGRILFGMGLVQDVSSHKVYEDRLAAAHAQLQSVLDGATRVMVIAADQRGIVDVYNAGAEQILGYAASEVIGRPIMDFICPSETEARSFKERASLDLGRPVDGYAAVWEWVKERGVVEDTWTISDRLGESLTVEVTLTGRRDPRGAVCGVIGVGIDKTHRHKAEQALKISQQKYQDLVDNLSVGVYRNTPGPEGRFLEVNPAMVKMLEADSMEDVLKISVRSLYKNPEKRKEFSDKLMRQSFVKNEEIELVSLKGRTFYASVTAALKTDEKGEVYYYGIIQDITEQKQMEQSLYEERDRLRTIASHIGAGLCLLDRDLRVVWVNEVVEGWFGKLEKYAGRFCYEVFQSRLSLCPTCSSRSAFDTGCMHNAEQRYVFPNGMTKDILVISSPIHGASGQVTQVLELMLDVTERKNLENELKRYSESLEAEVKERTQALQTSELMFRRLFESAQDGILIIEAQSGSIIDVNPHLLQMLSCTREQVLGLSFRNLPFFEKSRILEKALAELQEKISAHYDDVSLQTAAGQDISVECHASFYYVEGRKMVQCNIRDITERKKLEKIKTEFVSMVSHELRTPLSAIKEGVEIVSDGTQGKLNRDQKECLGIALSNIHRLNRLIGDILDISKIQSNLLRVALVPCDVREVIDHVYSLVRIEIEKRGMVLVTDIDRRVGRVMADRDRLIQVLMNLLNNAVKFTRERSRITVGVVVQGDQVEFSVRDEGPGIPPDELTRLFGRFVQLDSTLVRRVGGTGLGLYISKNLVEAMNGRIWAESKSGEGSVFRFTLSVARS